MKIGIVSIRHKHQKLNRKELILSLKEKGYDVYIIGLNDSSKLHDDYKKLGVNYLGLEISRVNLNPLTESISILRISKTLKKYKFDKILIYGIRLFPLIIIASKISKTDKIVGIVNGTGRLFRLKGFKRFLSTIFAYPILKYAFTQLDHVIFQNKDDKKLLEDKKILGNTSNTIVNGSGVNLDDFQQLKKYKNTGYTFIGRLTQDKGINEFLDATLNMKEKHPNVEINVVGNIDENNNELLTRISDLSDKKLINWVKFLDDITPVLKKTSVFILPSYYEGTPRTVLEAMASGIPIITTDAPGCKDTVEEGFNGYLVPIKNSSEIIFKLEYLFNNNSKIEELGNNSRKRAENKYNIHDINKIIVNIIN